jgi:hypothetical protein
LKNAPELGSSQIGKEGITQIMLTMAQSDDKVQQIVAAEAIIAACAKKKDTISIISHVSKCFTYVTKTIAKLTIYSIKLGDYNGTIIFEIDIMKNSSPLNLKFTFFATTKPK